MVVIIESLSGITAGSLMVGNPIFWSKDQLVYQSINPGLIEDLWIKPLRPKTSEIAKEQERAGGAAGNCTRAIGLPCQCSATKVQLPPATTFGPK